MICVSKGNLALAVLELFLCGRLEILGTIADLLIVEEAVMSTLSLLHA